MKAAVYSLNAMALLALSLPVWLIFQALAARGGDWTGGLFIVLTATGVGAWGVAFTLLFRRNPTWATPPILAGAIAFLAAFAVAFMGG